MWQGAAGMVTSHGVGRPRSLFSSQASVSNASTLRFLKIACHCRGKNQMYAYSKWGAARAAHTAQLLCSRLRGMVAEGGRQLDRPALDCGPCVAR